MTTRHKQTPGPIYHGRYMSSPEFAELHGVSGVAVSARAAVLLNGRRKNLIWFIQGLSLAEGGLKRVARELVEMFPKRIRKDDFDLALRRPEHTNMICMALLAADNLWKRSWRICASILESNSPCRARLLKCRKSSVIP